MAWLTAFDQIGVDNHTAEMGVVRLKNAMLVRRLTREFVLPMDDVTMASTQKACASPGRYWADYNDLKRLGDGCGQAGGEALGLFPMYVRSFTDSLAGNNMCAVNGTPQHVGAVTFFE